ncbi:MAG TPA: GDSL-type esterase/lipase family protein [Microbacterium sp.]|nr:GDSL-type esterase/lipase family protein [Microbacterium sp.]
MARSSHRRCPRRLTVVAVSWVIGAAAALCAIGGLVMLWWFGRDDPRQYEGQVDAVEKRFADGHPQGGVLLSGSSFFEYWEDSTADLAPLHTTNIGIGGTKVADHLAHFDRMVVPFHPRALVLYIGSNDISGIPLFTKSAQETVSLIDEYIARVRAELPDTRIYYVAITEAPSRARVRDEIRAANRMLAERAERSGDFVFIDTAPALLTADGSIDGSLFRADRLHFNEKGYARFAAAVRAGLAPEY